MFDNTEDTRFAPLVNAQWRRERKALRRRLAAQASAEEQVAMLGGEALAMLDVAVALLGRATNLPQSCVLRALRQARGL